MLSTTAWRNCHAQSATLNPFLPVFQLPMYVLRRDTGEMRIVVFGQPYSVHKGTVKVTRPHAGLNVRDGPLRTLADELTCNLRTMNGEILPAPTGNNSKVAVGPTGKLERFHGDDTEGGEDRKEGPRYGAQAVRIRQADRQADR